MRKFRICATAHNVILPLPLMYYYILLYEVGFLNTILVFKSIRLWLIKCRIPIRDETFLRRDIGIFPRIQQRRIRLINNKHALFLHPLDSPTKSCWIPPNIKCVFEECRFNNSGWVHGPRANVEKSPSICFSFDFLCVLFVAKVSRTRAKSDHQMPLLEKLQFVDLFFLPFFGLLSWARHAACDGT